VDAIKRARRLFRLVLNSLLVLTWITTLVVGVAELVGGVSPWVRVVPALIAVGLFSWFYLRITEAVLDGRYATREIVAAGVLAVTASLLGGGDPIGLGVAMVAWVSVATLCCSGWRATFVSAGAFVAGMATGVLGVLTGQATSASYLGDKTAAIVYVGLLYGVLCVFMPPSNRLFAWIYLLAVQAHEGREAHTRLAVAEERLRFARDLHDLVGHQLSAIAVKTELAVRLSDADPVAARAEMTQVNTLTRKALRELRQAVRGYRELDLAAELNSVKGVLEAAGVRCDVHLPYRPLPDGVAPVFAYAVREAVTNVLKHSSATCCEIAIRFTDDQAELKVRNDGVTRGSVEDLGSGLAGMGERLLAAGGEVDARPTGDGEFVLRAVVSLPFHG
jgi:two-component system sensor histidine kinase DesK